MRYVVHEAELYQRQADELKHDGNEMDALKLLMYKKSANNAAQTNELINRLAPAATPSWIVSSPYTSIYPPVTTSASTGG